MTAPPLPSSPLSARRDALPPWVAVLLGLFLVLRVGQVARISKSADNLVVQGLTETDLRAKSAYGLSLRDPGLVVKPDVPTLQEALKTAEKLQADSQNAPGAARRVLLLRSALGQPPLAAGRNHLDPLAAFTTALPPDSPPADKARYGAEGRLWKSVFGGPLSPHQTADAEAQIRHLPNIRWWQYPALSSLYRGQGDLSQASLYARQARSHAVPSLIGVSLIGLLRGVLALAGALTLIYLGLRAVGKTATVPDLWPTLPERQPFSERRLGAGDLMAVFVVYLVSREVIGLLLAGFTGFGRPHLLEFPGLLTPFRATVEQRPALQVVLEAAEYLLSAVPPVLYLVSMARRRGASLADELGWGRRALWPNAVYGVVGFGLASVLMIAVAVQASRLHTPSPSNPVIPQLINTPGFWPTVLLVVLASVAAPLIEELLFRGVFYNAAKLRLGVWPAIVLTGLVFGFVHPVGVAEMLAIAVLGGVFAWMAETRKSLVPGIVGHFINNFTSTLLLLFLLAG